MTVKYSNDLFHVDFVRIHFFPAMISILENEQIPRVLTAANKAVNGLFASSPGEVKNQYKERLLDIALKGLEFESSMVVEEVLTRIFVISEAKDDNLRK